MFGLTKTVPTLDIHMQAALQKQDAFEKWVVNDKVVKAALAIAQEQQAVYDQALMQYQTATSQQFAEAADPANPLPEPLPMPAPPPSVLDGTPLKWQPWYNAPIHLQEFLKWANDDHVRELMVKIPVVESILRMHMQEIIAAMPAPVEAPGAPAPGGAAVAMQNSNSNSAPAGNKAQPEHIAGKQSPAK